MRIKPYFFLCCAIVRYSKSYLLHLPPEDSLNRSASVPRFMHLSSKDSIFSGMNLLSLRPVGIWVEIQNNMGWRFLEKYLKSVISGSFMYSEINTVVKNCPPLKGKLIKDKSLKWQWQCAQAQSNISTAIFSFPDAVLLQLWHQIII